MSDVRGVLLNRTPASCSQKALHCSSDGHAVTPGPTAGLQVKHHSGGLVDESLQDLGQSERHVHSNCGGKLAQTAAHRPTITLHAHPLHPCPISQAAMLQQMLADACATPLSITKATQALQYTKTRCCTDTTLAHACTNVSC
jgi:hypothetical protein